MPHFKKGPSFDLPANWALFGKIVAIWIPNARILHPYPNCAVLCYSRNARAVPAAADEASQR